MCNLETDFILFLAVLSKCDFVVLDSFDSRLTVATMWRASAGHNVTASVDNGDDDDWDTDPDFVVRYLVLSVYLHSQYLFVYTVLVALFSQNWSTFSRYDSPND